MEQIIKLASNENPLGPSPCAVESIREQASNVHIYPDGSAAELKADIAEMYGVSTEEIIVGNGVEEILKLISEHIINPGDEAIMADLTFSLYERVVTLMGGVPVKLPLKNFKHDFEGFVARVNDRTKMIFVCNPNNPTGNIMTREEMDYLVSNIPEHMVLVIDEAYFEYARRNKNYPDGLEIFKRRPSTIVLRTFTNVSGIAGVRLGYAFAAKDLVGEIGKVKGAFSVNVIAQAAGGAALKDREHIRKTVDLNYESMEMMEKYFEDKNMEYIKSNANFIFVNVGIDTRKVFQKLLEKGITIRPGFLWGMDTWLRVSTGTIEQTRAFIAALDEI